MVNCAFIVGPLQYWTMREVFGMQCVRMRPPSQGTLEQPLWLQRDPENSRSLLSVLCECAWMVKLAAAEFHTWKLDRGKLRRRSGWIKLSAEIANGYWMINIWHFPQWKFIDWVEYGLLLYISSSTKPSPVNSVTQFIKHDKHLRLDLDQRPWRHRHQNVWMKSNEIIEQWIFPNSSSRTIPRINWRRSRVERKRNLKMSKISLRNNGCTATTWRDQLICVEKEETNANERSTWKS